MTADGLNVIGPLYLPCQRRAAMAWKEKALLLLGECTRSWFVNTLFLSERCLSSSAFVIWNRQIFRQLHFLLRLVLAAAGFF
jgi:hypothetical protein